MFDYLIKHAMLNVWCTPDQDNQVIVKPARITPPAGVWNTYKWLWTSLDMPEPTSRFHLYQIGQVHPLLLNLFAQERRWITLAEACTVGTTIADVYVASGVQLPRFETWYYVTREKNLILAVKRNDKINFNFNTDDIYLRVYDNAYFNSVRSSPANDYVRVEGARANTMQQLLDLQVKYNAVKDLPGGTYCFVNGYKRPNISLLTMQIGDVGEFVYDSSITKVIDWQVKTLPTFDSELDVKGKYLLHYAGDDQHTIDFYDDVDLFMVDAVTQKGVYVHKNAADTVRMLSHRDYAVPVSYLHAYFPHFADPVTGTWNLDNLYLRMHVRKSGWNRALVPEHHRIHELYKMADADIRAAMLGIDSTVSVWRAPELELSKYPKIMGSKPNDIDNDMVKEAYGYHAVATLVANTPQKLDTNKTAILPYLLMFDATVYEYDGNGLLLNWYRHTSGPTYVARSANAVYIEALFGAGGNALDEQYDIRTCVLDASSSYRYYIQPYVGGVPGGTWQDVTGSNRYSANATQAVWLDDPSVVTLVRGDRKHLVKRLAVNAAQGVFSFKLTQWQTRGDEESEYPLEVPLGEMDVFLNGHSLIANLDFFQEDDTVFIVNKKYLINNGAGAQDVVVRHTGFCTSELKTQMSNEFGYLQQGRISVNQRFDIHDGKVLRIIAGGRLHLREELNFSEDELTYQFDDEDNGKPYLIRDLVVPMRNLVDETTYEYRAKSLAVDTEISDYLTIKVPQDQEEEVNPIPERYTLFSPFFSKLIWACQTDAIGGAQLWEHYTDNDVRAICAPYEYLLEVDPIQVENQLNPDYVIVHPLYHATEVNLDLARYRFLTKAVRIYGNGLISLSSFVKLVNS